MRRKHSPPSPNMVDTERYERLLEIIAEIDEASRHAAVIVEGRRDAEALRVLGVEGHLLTVNQGLPLHDFCQEVLGQFSSVVLLTDWDGTGRKLHDKLSEELAGAWEEHSDLRRMLMVLCQKEVRDVEGIPGLVRRLQANAIPGA